MSEYSPFIILFAILAVLSRQNFVLTLIYLLLGVSFGVRWWSRRAMEAIASGRVFSAQHAFIGEKITVRLSLRNRGWLPVVWLQLHESLPVGMATPAFMERVISLSPHEHQQIDYTLEASRRGYYPIGPLFLYSGDVLGFRQESRQDLPDHVTVYPKIVPLPRLWLPSRAPLGTLRHTQPIFEDLSRVIGKRDYVAGDSLRRVDWKTTAALGRLQVKQFEPSINLEMAVVLNLNAEEYTRSTRSDDSELAVVVAASVAARVTELRQAAGLMTNGFDPLGAGHAFHTLPPRKGRGHLRRVLEVLARIEVAETRPLSELLRRAAVQFAWGTTLVIVTHRVDVSLLESLIQVSRAGLNPMLILCGSPVDAGDAEQRARSLGFQTYRVRRERDLDLWRN